MVKCPICGELIELIVTNTCRKCGLVYAEGDTSVRLDMNPEISRRERKKQAYNSRKSVMLNPADPKLLNLTTRHSSKTSNKELKRAFKNEARFMRNGDYYGIVTEIKRIISALQLPPFIATDSINLYNSILKEDQTFFDKNYFKYAGVAACIVVCCRLNNVAISFKKIMTQSTEKMKHVRSMYSNIIRLFNFPIPITKMESYLPELLSEFPNKKFSQEFINRMVKVVNFIEKNMKTSGRNPRGYVAAILYIYGKEYKLRRDQIAKKAGVSPPTITDRAREIRKFVERVKKK